MTVSSSVLHQIEQILITKYVCPRTEIDTDLKTVIYSLKEHKNRAPCVIVYCRSLDIYTDLYPHFHYELGDDSYYPPGSHKISDNHLFGMFHVHPQYNKEVILEILTQPDGIARVVFATVALGIGINLRDLNTIITMVDHKALTITSKRVGEKVDGVSLLIQLCFGSQLTVKYEKSRPVHEIMK